MSEYSNEKVGDDLLFITRIKELLGAFIIELYLIYDALDFFQVSKSMWLS